MQSVRISKITAVFAIFLISFLLFPLFSTANLKSLYAADTYSPETDFTYTLADGKATDVMYKGSATTVNIPLTLGGFPVTSIGKFAFEYSPNLTSISIPSGVTSIGEVAFAGCKELDDVEFTAPSTVQTIGDQAFQTCILLTSISIPSSVTSIGNYAFAGCTNLETVTFKRETAPSFGDVSFGDNDHPIHTGAIAYVPYGSKGTGLGQYDSTKYPFILGSPLTLTESPATVITIAAIPGVSAPVTGATPVTTITGTNQYTGTIAWSGSPATFAASTPYTATITLTPKTGFTLTGIAANFFTVSGATATNAVNPVTVSAVFPATAADPVPPDVTPEAPSGSAPPRPLTAEEIVALSLTMQQQINTYGATANGFVEMLHDNVLGRVPEDEGLNGWEANLNNTMTGSQIAYYFIFSAELAPTVNSLSDNDFIAFLYTTLLNRPHEPGGYAGWQEQMELGMTREELVNHFVNSSEFAGICTLFNVTP